MTPSPWWYQLRGLLFGVIYGAGFFTAAALSRTLHLADRATYLLVGDALGRGQAALAIATALMALCWFLRAWGSAYLHADVVWDPRARTERLVTAGPFRYTRNPLYLGNMLMSVSVGSLAAPVGTAIIIAASGLFIACLVGHETGELRLRFGPVADAYIANVPAFFPRLGSKATFASPSRAPSLQQGLRSEIFTACVTLGMLTFLIVGSRAQPAVLVACVVSWVVQQAATWPRVAVADPRTIGEPATPERLHRLQ